MKKNIKWLRKEFDSLFNGKSILTVGKSVVDEILDQLDEPEVLSSDWISKNVVHVRGLGDIIEAEAVENLLLPKQEVLSEGWLEENKSSWYKLKVDGYYISVEKLQNLLVPEPELPSIPQFVADYIDDRKEVGFPIYQAIRIVRENSRFEHSHLREWLWTNKGQETFVRAWLDGYTVEEEQKYFVEDGKHALLCKWESLDGWKVISTIESTEDDIPIEVLDYGLTEQEIKDYDPRYMTFAKPVEELEE